MADPVNDPFAAPPSVAARSTSPVPTAPPPGVENAAPSGPSGRPRWPIVAGVAALAVVAAVVGVLVVGGDDDSGSVG